VPVGGHVARLRKANAVLATYAADFTLRAIWRHRSNDPHIALNYIRFIVIRCNIVSALCLRNYS